MTELRKEDFPFKCTILNDEIFVIAPTWEINSRLSYESFETVLKTKPRLAGRDYGCLEGGEYNWLFPDRSIIETRANKQRIMPVDESGLILVKPNPRFNYYAHLDLSVSRDATGLAIGHMSDKGIVVIDFMLRRVVPVGGQLKFWDTRKYIDLWYEAGGHFAKITLDRFQSYETKQHLERTFDCVEFFSVDANTKAYDTLYELIYGAKIDYPAYTPFMEEARDLIVIGGKKVDHLKGKSKDVADCVAAVAYHVVVAEVESDKQVARLISVRRGR